jgi:peptide deformylase
LYFCKKYLMILPIVPYGDLILKRRAEEIDTSYPGLDELIANMYETMYDAHGVGLAAPQVGKSIRLFVVDGAPFAEDEEDAEDLKDFKMVFINPEMIEEKGERWGFIEGCLSIPNIREEVMREPEILIRYQDENFKEHEKRFIGYRARIIQHEYDHLEGILFTDRISPLRRRMLRGKLNDITKGKADVGYRMRYPAKTK